MGESFLSITYDDGLRSQYDVGLRHLGERSLPATYFVPIATTNVPIGYWAKMHPRYEIGNHTVSHPTPRRLKLNPPYLEDYRTTEFWEDVRRADEAIVSTGRPAPVSFAWPCYEAPERLVLPKRFLAGRAGWPTDPEGAFLPLSPTHSLVSHRFDRVASVPVAEVGVTETLRYLDEAAKFASTGESIWAVLTFHGIGGDYLSITPEEHQTVLDAVVHHRRHWTILPFGHVAAILRGRALVRRRS